jgi:hypothetical protein
VRQSKSSSTYVTGAPEEHREILEQKKNDCPLSSMNSKNDKHKAKYLTVQTAEIKDKDKNLKSSHRRR